MITGIHESKTLTKHILCDCNYKFGTSKCSSNQKWNNDKCQCECKNPKEHNVWEKNYIWNPATCSCKIGKYLGGIIDKFSDYVQWDCRYDKNCSSKKYFNKNHSSKK